MQVSIWQLANDEATYGHNAGKFVVVTPDGEDEPYPYRGRFFDSEEDARLAAESIEDEVVVLEAAPQ